MQLRFFLTLNRVNWIIPFFKREKSKKKKKKKKPALTLKAGEI